MARAINRSFFLGLLIALTAVAPVSARDKSRSAAPANNSAGWFTGKDYPPVARKGQMQGRVGIELTIDTNGKVIACLVTSTSGWPLLDELTCNLARERAKFTPARNTAGQPIVAKYPLGTRWFLPEDSPPQELAVLAAPWRVWSIVRIDRAGTILSCVNQPPVGPAPPFPTACPLQDVTKDQGLSMRGGADGPDVVEVIMETGAHFDGGTKPEMESDKPGRETFARVIISYVVKPNGSVRECKGPPDRDPPPRAVCAGPWPRYASFAGPARLLVLDFVSSRSTR